MITLSEAYARGAAAGEMAMQTDIKGMIEPTVKNMHSWYPLLAGHDILQEIYDLDCERMANPPDPYKYPETKGLPDLVREERRAFQQTTGYSNMEMAYNYTWHFYITRRVQTRYIGMAPPPGECSAAYIRNSTEGGPLYGRNWDTGISDWVNRLLVPPRVAADGKRVMWMKGVSFSIFLDEEPEEIFPVDPLALLPADCTEHVEDAVEFLTRYRDFWGPVNCILVDKNHDSVAIEKANVRLGVRHADDGASCVSALACLHPEMKAYKEARDRLSIERRGGTLDEMLDWKVWRGKDKRYARLDTLVKAASRKGASLQDMANCMLDHELPWPERVAEAGHSFQDIPLEQGEWTSCSHSEVLEGPNRRMHFYRVENYTPCYDLPPILIPGVGVEIKPEWQVGTRPLPQPAGTPRPLYQEEYPNMRMMF